MKNPARGSKVLIIAFSALVFCFLVAVLCRVN
jgi:hypothetical protein